MDSQIHSQASTNYKEAFSLFDKRGTGRVSLDCLGDLLRACGQNPTLAEIDDLEKTAGGECKSLPPNTHTALQEISLVSHSPLQLGLKVPSR
jgi:hypothetical protein